MLTLRMLHKGTIQSRLPTPPISQATCAEPDPQLKRFQVSPNVAETPQLWDGIVQHLSGVATSSVLYVSPVAVNGDLYEQQQEQPAISCFLSAACDSAREVGSWPPCHTKCNCQLCVRRHLDSSISGS